MNVDEYTHPASMYVLVPRFQLILMLILNPPSAHQEPKERTCDRTTRVFEIEMNEIPLHSRLWAKSERRSSHFCSLVHDRRGVSSSFGEVPGKPFIIYILLPTRYRHIPLLVCMIVMESNTPDVSPMDPFGTVKSMTQAEYRGWRTT